MKSVNRVTLLGHVAADPSLHETKSGKAVVHFPVATNNEWLDSDGNPQRDVNFHRIVAWQGLANLCNKHLKKGTPIYLEGRLTNRSYEAQDRMKHFITEILLNTIHILKWQENGQQVATEELAAA